MNYRKQKKELKKQLKMALKHLDAHPISNSANGWVKVVQFELQELKENKKRA